MKQERPRETICSTFSLDLDPIVHRRSQDHVLNRVRIFVSLSSKGSESLAPSYRCCAHDNHAISRGAFLSFSKARFVFDELSGWNPYTSILYDHPKEEKKSSFGHKRKVLIAISPSLQSQGLAIKPKPSMS
jgi:hypothetical protein